jgi:hypothetical protein
MAHWAEIDNNNVVLRVVVGSNNAPDEGYQWLIDNLGGTWIKTSYNAMGGKRIDPQTGELTNDPGFRKNYAAVGGYYDADRDAFVPPKPNDIETENVSITYVLNEETCLWDWEVTKTVK